MHETRKLSFKRTQDVTLVGFVRRIFRFYLKFIFLKSQKDYFLRENQSFSGNFPHLCKILLQPSETFPSAISSIEAQLHIRLLKARLRKTPRWQPRGHDTQFFRPLVQEEEVSSRGSLP